MIAKPRLATLWLLAFFCASLTGCALAPKSQLAAVEAKNRVLVEQNRAQLAEIENLRAHSRQVEDQIILAEEELALLAQQHGLEGGQWPSRRGGALGSAMPSSLSRRLDELSQRYPSLQFDRATGVSKLDTDVLFDAGDAQMKPEARELLTEFADILLAPEAAELRIMVVGHTDDRRIARKDTREQFADNWQLSTARALAVSDYLRRLGVPEQQMGVAGFGEHQPVAPNSMAETRRHNRRVEIFVMSPETPMVGWADTRSQLR